MPDRATKRPVDGRKPEEKVRQEYEKILNEDHGYSFGQMDIEVHIQRGHAQKPKADADRADIVIYKTADPAKRDQNRDILGIVEVKRPRREDGVRQLMSYMSASSCLWGVWTNRDEIEYLYKNPKSGEILRDYIFQIPRVGQSIEDIGEFQKKGLWPAKNLKPIFRRILNVLYANTNISRREKLGSEMTRLLFCKIWDEQYELESPPEFRVKPGERPESVKKRIEALFSEVKEELVEDGVFDDNEKILLDPKSVAYVVGELQQFSLSRTDKDIIGDAFEVFAESKFVGEKGEFFTPREVVKMCVDIIDPKPQERIFDPACGSGGFLIYALEHVWKRMETDPRYRGSPNLKDEKRKVAERYFLGIDKEIDLVKIAKAYMAIVGDGRGNVIQENTLHRLQDWTPRAKEIFLKDGVPKKVQVILTNPPFGSKIKVIDKEDLANFDLGHKWVKQGGKWVKTNKVQKTEPQILFIERCLDFLEDGGRMAIVLPDGIFGNPTDGWVRQYIKDRAEILAVVDCPPDTFMPHTHTKTSVLILRKWGGKRTRNYPIFCGVVKKCGHDARGNDLRRANGALDEEFSDVARKYNESNNRVAKRRERTGFTLYEGGLVNDILIPRYYNPDTDKEIDQFARSGKYRVQSIDGLRKEGVLSVKGAGATVRPTDYGTGDVPFVRTSDISNLEINHDTPHKVSRDLWEQFQEKQDLRPGDILFVKDGTFLIGDTAMVTEFDVGCLVQSHFLILRSLDVKQLDPYLLLFLLNTEIVKRQISEKTFVQATLSTIGNRFGEVRLPIPTSAAERDRIFKGMEKVRERAKMREDIRKLTSEGGLS
ncbi:MAG: N-6 DNA methylase [Halobacteria archaeon]